MRMYNQKAKTTMFGFRMILFIKVSRALKESLIYYILCKRGGIPIEQNECYDKQLARLILSDELTVKALLPKEGMGCMEGRMGMPMFTDLDNDACMGKIAVEGRVSKDDCDILIIKIPHNIGESLISAIVHFYDTVVITPNNACGGYNVYQSSSLIDARAMVKRVKGIERELNL